MVQLKEETKSQSIWRIKHKHTELCSMEFQTRKVCFSNEDEHFLHKAFFCVLDFFFIYWEIQKVKLLETTAFVMYIHIPFMGPFIIYHKWNLSKSIKGCCNFLNNWITYYAWKMAFYYLSEYLVADATFSEKAMAPNSSTLAWRIPGTGEPDGLPSMGSHRVGRDWSDLAAAVACYFLSLIDMYKS